MSRFFHGSSDSESESDSFSESISDVSEDEQVIVQKKESKFSKYMKDSDSESEEEDGKRVVRSQKDKFNDDLKNIIRLLDNGKKINDFTSINNEFDKLLKLIISKENSLLKSHYPKMFIQSLTELEEFLSSVSSEAKKKMGASNAKALTVLKQKFKKSVKHFENPIALYRKNPDEYADNQMSAVLPVLPPLSTSDRPKSVAFADNDNEGFVTVEKESISSKLKHLLESRGKKGTDKNNLIISLENLQRLAKTVDEKVKVLIALVSSRLDVLSLTIPTWNTTLEEVNSIFDILEKNTIHGNDEISENNIKGSLVAFVSRLDDEFMKSLQKIDPHTMDYIERLRDELPLYGLIKRAESYFTDIESLCMLKMLRLDHTYFKYDHVIKLIEQENPVVDLCVYLYKNGSDRLRARAVLCQVYYLALNKNFYEARDLLLMSHLQDSIANADVSTQILYNRAMAQIGVSAFRRGLILEAHECLNDIMGYIKSKDILAQNKDTQKDRQKQQPTIPFHMHINLELLEAIQLTVSMLLEIPNSQKKVTFSKHFRKLYEITERQVFIAYPENFKEHIIHASRVLLSGDWQKCAELILSINIWKLFPENIGDMLTPKIKEAALKAFLNNGCYYDNISIKLLSEQFGLENDKVYALVSFMILKNELSASVDKEKEIILFYDTPVNDLDAAISGFLERAPSSLENTEKMLDHVKKLSDKHKKTVDEVS